MSECLLGRSIDQALALLDQHKATTPPHLVPSIHILSRFQRGRKVMVGAAAGLTFLSLVGTRYFRVDLCLYRGTQIRRRIPASLLILPIPFLSLWIISCLHQRALKRTVAVLACHAAENGLKGGIWEYYRQNGTRFQDLDLSLAGDDVPPWSAFTVRSITALSPNLTRLRIRPDQLSPEDLAAVAISCPKLASLQLDGTCTWSDQDYQIFNSPALSTLSQLTIKEAPNLTTEGFTLLTRHRWRQLALGATQIGIGAAAALHSQSDLHDLSLQSPKLSLEEFAALKSLPALSELILDRQGHPDDRSAKELLTALKGNRRNAWVVLRAENACYQYQFHANDRSSGGYAGGHGGSGGGWSVGFSYRG